MSYYLSTALDAGFDEAIVRVEEALKKAGFGILTRIDVHETMKAKLGLDLAPYVILGACNPKLAYEALQLENKVGTMLPCNVVVQQLSSGKVEVAAIDPVASMQAIDNPRLKGAALAVREKLSRVIEKL
ncbi:DUF302 domain-containing protein [Novosphingobium mangrovi (ex Huang et al. 2023)]|uniref:DUF302 domain-containing protein n=1 Tax=Novosphingobium mangrovi (ex Huang et al. 2023) TaxID=2976432 RepID=A0ABT2I697_9SPHN|nr:DUF302 domain-containing protein [Novosphingobium mangrovi (ex Huang et al. 2023)]MCT2400339.1 DUF302 domain-containing protein [Novosphingobium mangrovi (ex Huang et al. 2023)]